MENLPEDPQVVIIPTETGWEVHSPQSDEPEFAESLVEAMTLGDLIAEEIGLPSPESRSASQAVRRQVSRTLPETSEPEDPREAQILELTNTMLGLEHALKTRVVLERAIGFMAARHGLSPRAAFEVIRGESRRTGTPTAEIARVVLTDLVTDSNPGPENQPE